MPTAIATKKFELIDSTDIGANLILNKLRNPARLALLTVEAGGGKTYMAIHAIGKVFKNAHIVMVGPLIKIIDQDWIHSIDAYNKEMNTSLSIELYNYEKTQDTKRLNKIIKNIKATKDPCVLIVDEAQHIKSDGVRLNRILKLKKLDNVKATICLSATPITTSYLDAIGFLRLGSFYKTKKEFYKEQIKYWNDYHQPIVTNKQGLVIKDYFRNPLKIENILKSFIINIDVSYNKPKVRTITKVTELTKTERKEYNQILKKKREHWFENPQEALVAIRDYLSEHSTQKDEVLSDLIENYSWKKPVLIFYKHNNVLYHLLDLFETKYPDIEIRQINGHIKKKDKSVDEPENPKTILLIQYVSGSEGFNAPWSDTSIFYEPTPSYNEVHQAEARNVRAFQKGTVTHYMLDTKNTYYSHIWELSKYKEQFAKPLIDSFIEYVVSNTENTQTTEMIDLYTLVYNTLNSMLQSTLIQYTMSKNFTNYITDNVKYELDTDAYANAYSMISSVWYNYSIKQSNIKYYNAYGEYLYNYIIQNNNLTSNEQTALYDNYNKWYKMSFDQIADDAYKTAFDIVYNTYQYNKIMHPTDNTIQSKQLNQFYNILENNIILELNKYKRLQNINVAYVKSNIINQILQYVRYYYPGISNMLNQNPKYQNMFINECSNVIQKNIN